MFVYLSCCLSFVWPVCWAHLEPISNNSNDGGAALNWDDYWALRLVGNLTGYALLVVPITAVVILVRFNCLSKKCKFPRFVRKRF